MYRRLGQFGGGWGWGWGCGCGWAWAIQQCGAEVLSIDRGAPLSQLVAELKGISFQKRDAFTLSHEEFEERSVDWLFSDIICYPDKLYARYG